MAVVYKIKRFNAPQPQRPLQQRTRPTASPAELQLRRAKEIRLREQGKAKIEAAREKQRIQTRKIEEKRAENITNKTQKAISNSLDRNPGKAPSLVSSLTRPTETFSVNK